MKLHFYIRFHTKFGQSLWLSGNADFAGNNDPLRALPLAYFDDESWHIEIEIKSKDLLSSFRYNYFLKDENGEVTSEWGNDRSIKGFSKGTKEIQVTDTWNYAGEFENVFFSKPFKNIFLKNTQLKRKKEEPKRLTHIFKVKAPLLKKDESVCILGSSKSLGDWSTEKPILLDKEDDWCTIKLDLKRNSFPVIYKYGVYNRKSKTFICYENGNNRVLCSGVARKKIHILHDGFLRLPNNTWKGTGVAIPVFSLRSKNSFGVGEFADLKLLADWAKQAGIKLLQLLPINDTSVDFSWKDSYPYSAISAFALHPVYINLAKVAGKEYAEIIKLLHKAQKQLNELPEADYERTIVYKLVALKDLYAVMGEKCFASNDYKNFFGSNQHWLVPYAAFCFLRDKYSTADFNDWGNYAVFNKTEIEKFCQPGSESYNKISFWWFVQYHLHCQLEEAIDHAHKKGVVLKGDLPIGVSRKSCDAWMNPELFDMNSQIGAPPDDFSVKGQNWGFPSYNWAKMKEDGFAWWKQRFNQMSNYFDAFRIDHILGFFRIWNIPLHAVEGIMGHFVPAIPVHINEFGENGIWLDHYRYCKPFINDDVLAETFGELAEKIKTDFLTPNEVGCYNLLPELETQRQVKNYFATLEKNEENQKLKQGLYDLISNVILFEEENSQGERFHFRIGMEKTSSFRNLIPFVQEKLRTISINYFYYRQDDFWAKEAMHKLPQLKATTDMLVCGEDLGMVPHCVPEVMKQLGILSLEIQRMPKATGIEFFHPDNAPYLSVITPSTHDMSTIRIWWEEDGSKSQRFYNTMLGQHGDAPQICEAWISRAIVLQHLYSPAMWSIFQLQDILGMSETLRRKNPNEERINVPADTNNYWNYRMHINLEELIKAKDFNEELKGYIIHSGRN